jgi:hypothetical protein
VSATLARIQPLVGQGDWQTSDHAAQRMLDQGVAGADLEASIGTAIVIEDYPAYYAGPCIK